MLERIREAQLVMDEACQKVGRRVNIMEVCGTHTVSIFRNGIKSTLNPQIRLISGPGCPVCVTDSSYIDTALRLAGRRDVIIATYGDMMRVPGRDSSLEAARAKYNNISIVLSATDAVELAQRNTDRTVVFLAVGFETTTPATAVAVNEAVGNTRIHLDQVEGLGPFMELEVVLGPGQSDAEGQAIATELMETLGIAETDLIEVAYIDLLEGLG